MRLTIDTTNVTFFCTRAAEPRTDRETGAARIDRESNLPLWQVQLAALDPSGGEVLAVTVAGQPAVQVGAPVEVRGLVAIPWSQGDRSGVAYRAAELRPLNGPSFTGTPNGERAAATSKPNS